MLSWLWLRQHGKTPADLGLSWSEVDPAWRRAMIILDGAFEHEQAMRRESR